MGKISGYGGKLFLDFGEDGISFAAVGGGNVCAGRLDYWDLFGVELLGDRCLSMFG